MAALLDGRFAAETTADLTAVKAALGAIDQELALAEAAAPAAALRVHTGKAETGDADLLASLPDLRSKAEALRFAFEGAQQAEADRLHARKVEAANAQKRACSQHLSRVRKAGEKAASALQVVARCYAEMAEATRAASACAPARVRAEYVIEQGLAPERVSRLFIVELARCLQAMHVSPPRSWTMWSSDVSRSGQVVPLAELLGIYVQRVSPFLQVTKNSAVPSVAEPAAVSETSSPEAAAPLFEPVLNETETLIAAELKRMKGAAA